MVSCWCERSRERAYDRKAIKAGRTWSCGIGCSRRAVAS